MTKRTYTTKSGTTFEWDETPEINKILKEFHGTNVGTVKGGRQQTPQKVEEN